jgi:hypothetical protein
MQAAARLRLLGSRLVARKVGIGDQIWGLLLVLLGVGLVVGGIGTVLYQCGLWVRDGYWTAIDLRDLTSGPPIHGKWVGLEKILRWFGEQSAGLAGIVIGTVVAIVGSNTMEGR